MDGETVQYFCNQRKGQTMTMVFQDDGIHQAAKGAAAKWNAEGLRIRLFKNSVSITQNSVLGDFTECDFDGYASVVISDLTFDTVSGNVADYVAASNAVFTKAAGATSNQVYGYYVTNDTTGELLFAERDPAGPINMAFTGQTYLVQARITSESLNHFSP